MKCFECGESSDSLTAVRTERIRIAGEQFELKFVECSKCHCRHMLSISVPGALDTIRRLVDKEQDLREVRLHHHGKCDAEKLILEDLHFIESFLNGLFKRGDKLRGYTNIK